MLHFQAVKMGPPSDTDQGWWLPSLTWLHSAPAAPLSKLTAFWGKATNAVSSSGWLQSLTSDRNPSQLVGPMFWIITQYFMENSSSPSRLCYYWGYFHHPKDSKDLELAFETANSRQWFWFHQPRISPTISASVELKLNAAIGSQVGSRVLQIILQNVHINVLYW